MPAATDVRQSPALRRAAPLLLVACLIAAPSRAQTGRRGVLVATITVDSAGGAPSGAEVVITDLQKLAKTNQLGEAVITDVAPGTHTVRVRALGYAPVVASLVFTGDTLATTFYLKPVAAIIDTVRVSATRVQPGLEAFEHRRAMGLGRFLTESQLDSAGAWDFRTLMTTKFPGLIVKTLSDGHRVLASTRGSCGADASRLGNQRVGKIGGGSSCFSNQPCVLPVFLDGQDFRDAWDIIRVWDLAGIEYYSGTDVPAEYRASGSACGVLVAWSRR